MDEDTRIAIIKWINCLHIGPTIAAITELYDGRHFIGLLKIMKSGSSKDKFSLQKWTSTVKDFLEEHYDVGLKDELNFEDAQLKNEFELAKISILILCASIHCDDKEQFIKAMYKLDSSVQETIKSIFEGVLSPSGTTLCYDFAKVLKVAGPSSTATGMGSLSKKRLESSTSIEPQRGCLVYCNDGEDVNSPIKQCFQSPQVASWTALKEKEIEIHKLKGNLEAELTFRSYLEMDMQELKKENEKLSTNVESLKKTINELTEKCDDLNECQHSLADIKLAHQKLQVKCEELTRLASDYQSLETAFRSLSRENRALEKNFDSLKKQLKTSEVRVQELNNLEDSLAELNARLSSKENELRSLTVNLKDKENELTEVKNKNEEMTVVLENQSLCKERPSGETMSVISDQIALEEDVARRLGIKNAIIAELEASKIELNSKYDLLSSEKTDLEVQVSSCRAEVLKLTSDLQQTSSELFALTSEVTLQKMDLENTRKELAARDIHIKQLEIQDLEMVRKHEKLNEEKDNLILEKHSGLAEIDRLSQILSEKQSEVVNLEASVKDLNLKLENNLQDVKAKNAHIEELEICKSEMDKKYGILNNEKADLEAEISSCRKNIEILSSELFVLKSEAADQRRALENNCKKLEDKSARIKQLETRDVEMVEKYTKLLVENDNLILEKNSGLKEIECLCLNLKEKHSEVVNLEASVKEMEGKLGDYVKDLDVKNAFIAEHEAYKIESNSKYDLLSNENTDLEVQVSSCRAEVLKLTSDLQQTSSELFALTSEVTVQRTDLENTRKELEARDIHIKQLEIQELEMTEKHGKLKEEKDNLILEKNSGLKEIDRLCLNLKERHSEVANLQTTVKEIEGKLGDYVKDLDVKKAVIAELEACKIESNSKYDLLSNEKTDLEVQVSSCRAEVLKLTSDLQQTSSKLFSLTSEVTLQRTDLENTRKELEARDIHIKQLEIQDLEMAEKHDKLNEEKDNLKLEKNSGLAEIDRLSQNLTEKQSEVVNLEAHVKDLNLKLKNNLQDVTAKNAHIEELEICKSEIDKKYGILNNEKADLEAEISSCRKNIEILSSELFVLKSEAADLRTALENNCKELENRSERIEVLAKENLALVTETNSSREKLKRLDQWESQAIAQHEHRDSLLRKNMDLTTANGDLKIENQLLKSKLGRENDFFTKQKECEGQLIAMRDQIQDAEKRHHDILCSMMEEKKTLTNKYEKAKGMIEEMSGDMRTRDDEMEKLKSQLETYKEHYQVSRESLAKVMALHKVAEQKKSLLEESFNNELEKSTNQAAYIKKLELLLNQQAQRNRQDQLEDQFLKPQPVDQKLRGNPRRPSITVTYNAAESYQLMFEDQHHSTARSISGVPPEIRINDLNAQQRVVMPSGASNYFPCEDEEGELLNFSYLNDQSMDTKESLSKPVFVQPPCPLTSNKNPSLYGEDQFGTFSSSSYLNDLKSGRCEVPDECGRLSELQRRNTLCLPHLKTSYPVETQAHHSVIYNDEDLKTGKMDVTGLSQISAIHVDQPPDTTYALGARKKVTKPIQPTYQKPGPPTPGKSSKNGGQEKVSKTPASLKRLWNRAQLRTPKGAPKTRVTPKKNRENQPPEPTQRPKPRRNLAFTIGLSPKVKSHPKSLAMSKKTSTPKK